MASIAIITDSDSSLPEDIAVRYNICHVPICISFGDETFEDRVSMSDEMLFKRVDRDNKLPTTSAPSTGKFTEAFQAAFDAGHDAIVCINVSSEVSATYNAAVNAKDFFPGRDIQVVDSRRLSMSQGFMVLAAAEAAQRGASTQDVVATALDVGKRTQYYAALSTLKYLAMSGRVGYLAAQMANILNVKPILTIRNGKLDMLEKIRTRKKSLSRIIELASLTAGQTPIERMAIIHVNALEESKSFEKQLRAGMQCPDTILMCNLGAGLSVHSGQGLIAISYVLAA